MTVSSRVKCLRVIADRIEKLFRAFKYRTSPRSQTDFFTVVYCSSARNRAMASKLHSIVQNDQWTHNYHTSALGAFGFQLYKNLKMDVSRGYRASKMTSSDAHQSEDFYIAFERGELVLHFSLLQKHGSFSD